MSSELSVEKVKAIFAAHNEKQTRKKFSLEISDGDSEEVCFLKQEIAQHEEQNLILKGDLANCRDEKERLESVAMDNVDLAEEIYFTREALNKANETLTRQKEELHKLSITDTLTGAYNRRFIMDNLALLDNKKAANYAMLMLDIDHFKKVNDTYGHEAGDNALIEFANLCQEILPKNGFFGRLGGEEFAILLRGYSLKMALEFAEMLRQKIAQLKLEDQGTAFSITTSIGVAECLNGARSSLDILRLTDKALYDAKDQGRNRVVVAN
ncbi:GGDEF domain-containing protein [Sneathiella glossodoripedis]|uniref:GGDEF domain-containing protein n=1 Tax=Sneathiella glossodoripedis TaxID=418853 RepID=UPI0004718B5A|nr:GGDEF domain-containing protein [Sneathiella glossodoripedis]